MSIPYNSRQSGPSTQHLSLIAGGGEGKDLPYLQKVSFKILAFLLIKFWNFIEFMV